MWEKDVRLIVDSFMKITAPYSAAVKRAKQMLGVTKKHQTVMSTTQTRKCSYATLKLSDLPTLSICAWFSCP